MRIPYLILSLHHNDQEGYWYRKRPEASPNFVPNTESSLDIDPYRRLLYEINNWTLEWDDESNKAQEFIELFSNPEVIKYQKRRVRYVHARWGYSLCVMGYEVHNELNGKSTKPEKESWADEIACYLKGLDSDKIISLSTAHSPHSLSLSHSSCIDVEYPHYGDILTLNQRHGSYVKNLVTQRWITNQNKPTIAGDWGAAGHLSDNPVIDPLTNLPKENDDGEIIYHNCKPVEFTHNMMHNALWSSSFTGAYGPCYPFWFETDVFFLGDPNGNSWTIPNEGVFHFKPLTDFMGSESLNEGTWTPIANRPTWNASKDYDFPNFNSSASPNSNTWYYGSVEEEWWLGNPNNGYSPNGIDGKAWVGNHLLLDFTGVSYSPNVTTTNEEDIELFALRNVNKIIGWVHNKDYNWRNIPNNVEGTGAVACGGVEEAAADFEYDQIPTITDQSFTIHNLGTGLCEGEYKIEWYNTYSNRMDLHFHLSVDKVVSPWEGVDTDGDGNADLGGKFTSPAFQEFNQIVNANNGSITFKIPPLARLNLNEDEDSFFAPDYAFKITKLIPNNNQGQVEPIGLFSFDKYGSDRDCYYKLYAVGGGNATKFEWQIGTSTSTMSEIFETSGPTLDINFFENTSYIICARAINDCTVSDWFCMTVEFPSCSDRNDPEKDFQVNPNPAKDMIEIRNKSNSKMDFRILNRFGAVVSKVDQVDSNQSRSLNISNYQTGIYTVIGVNSEGKTTSLIFEKISD